MRKLVLAAVAALTLGSGASAAVITRTYSFTATDFASSHGMTQVAPVTGSVTVSFDPAVSVRNQATAIVNRASVAYQTPVVFSYRSDQDILAVTSAGAPDGFALTIREASATGRVLGGSLSYSTAGADEVLRARAVAVTPNGPARLPEPATWTMLVLGFGAIGWLARRRQRRAEAAFTERMRRIAAGEID